jgi:hypothetical protein
MTEPQGPVGNRSAVRPERAAEARQTKGLTMSYSIRTMCVRALGICLVAGSVLGAAATSKASSAYDGTWSVTIQASNGDCKTSHLPLKIDNGKVGYNGYVPVSVSGSVGGNGAVSVNLRGGGRTARGSGHLSGNSGSGTWTGSSSSSNCSGTWSASRA